MGRNQFVVLTLALNSIAAGCSWPEPTPPGRPIVYHPDKTIASRLLPDDKEVFVHYLKGSGPLIVLAPRPKSLDEEIESLRQSDGIAIVRVTDVQAELVESGAWVRTRVSADIEQILHLPSGTTVKGSLEFGLRGGTTRIGGTIVNAGIIPVYVEGERYLVALVARPTTQPGFALHINQQGQLEPIGTTAAGEPLGLSHLVGQNVADIALLFGQHR